MAHYEWQQIHHERGYGNEIEIEGEIVPGTVSNADPNSTLFTALVRLPEPTTTFVTDTEGVTESVASGQSPEDPECGVNGCSRPVDTPEDTCWQHDEDD